MSKREVLQRKLEEYYDDGVKYFDTDCLLDDLRDEGYQLIKIRNAAPRKARQVIVDFLNTFYRDDGDKYMPDIDEAILIQDLQDAGYQIVKQEGKE